MAPEEGGEECSKELCPIKCNKKIHLQFLDVDKFRRLLIETVLVLRLINNLKNNLNQEEEEVIKRSVTAEEYSKVEHLWLMFVQYDVTKINNYKQLEKDLNFEKDE